MREMLVLAGLLAASFPALAGESVIKCVLADGSIVFQQTDCPSTAATEKVKLRDADAGADLNRVAETIADEYPEIAASPSAIDAIAIRARELRSKGIVEHDAVLMAAAEFAGGGTRVTRGRSFAPEGESSQPHQTLPRQSSPNNANARDDVVAGYVLCISANGRETMQPPPCPAYTKSYTSTQATVNGQSVPVTVRQDTPVQERSMNKAEFCREEQERRFNRGRNEKSPDVYDRNKARLLEGKWVCD